MIWQIIIITAIAGVGGTGAGGLVAAMFRRNSSKTVSLLLSFAGGIMLSVVCFDLIDTAINPNGVKISVFLISAAILLGYGVVFLLNYFIDKTTNHEVSHIDKDHPKTHDNLDELIHYDHVEVHKQNHSQLFIAGVVTACCIALHNLPEGLVIGASYANTADMGVFWGSGLIMSIVIGLHNIPEGMAVSVPLIAGGMSRTRAVLVTAASGVPTIIGAALGYYLGTLGPQMLAISLSFASGAMLYVVFGELLPEAILMYKSKLPAFAVLVGMLVGIFIIFG